MNEEDALIEEQAFMENLTKAELRESRALCSSLRVKLKYYGDEIARLRFVDKIRRSMQPHLANHPPPVLSGTSLILVLPRTHPAVIVLAFDRQRVLDKVDDDEEDERRGGKVHNSLTTDGVSVPDLPKGKKAIDSAPARKQPTEVTRKDAERV